MLAFALNHMTAPRMGWEAFLDLTAKLGCVGVEFRNDLDGKLFDGADPATVKAAVAARGLKVLGLAQLTMFNDWSDAKRADADALMKIAAAIGAEGIALIPRNDNQGNADGVRQPALKTALRELLPMLRAHGLKGFVEPLGFGICSLRSKAEAVECIESLGGADTLKIVHDTFHHHLVGGGAVFPEHTGIVHVSGVTDRSVPLSDLRDGHRVLVDKDDVMGNVAQIAALREGGYTGAISFEPFSAQIHALTDFFGPLKASMEFIRTGVAATAAWAREYRTPGGGPDGREGVPDTIVEERP